MLLEESRYNELTETEKEVVNALQEIYDPEIPLNIYELGLIYNISVSPQNHALVEMTLTSPNCPVAQSLPAEITEKTMTVEGIETADVTIVWDPPWSPDRMSEAGKLTLGMF